ncbi:MAG: UDP-N-acetylmuramoyl-L-alanine--D-glutamate ligase [Opitutae bacterium]|nr:UDP-N-acetylmuramoyl-L-alanine--D-glutamate ligase [Opitutae bacterium]
MPLVVPSFLAPLLTAPVAVFGAGVSGRTMAELLAQLGASAAVYDERGGDGVACRFDATAHRLVVFSPGFRPEHPWLVAARAAGVVCLGELDFAALFWRGQVLAITGTNGKTTLTEFLAHALQGIGRDAFPTGNIGFSFSRLVSERDGGADDTVAVCEVSSFQSETLQHFRADAVLWTNFAEDHLERHPGLAAYFAAKRVLLTRAVGEVMYVGTSVARAAATLGYALPPAACVTTEGLAPEPRLAGSVFSDYPQRENFELARVWWRYAGLREADLFTAARSFHLGRHRLARVAEVAGVTYWNDSKATNFHAVEAALGRFAAPVLLIAGGKAKGGDLSAFVRRIAARVRHVFLIGETKQELAAHCKTAAVPHTLCVTLDEAVAEARSAARAGEQVLLSPGFASFDMFRGYDHRGDVFEQLVHNLGAPVAPSERPH